MHKTIIASRLPLRTCARCSIKAGARVTRRSQRVHLFRQAVRRLEHSLSKSKNYRGREVHSRFSFAVRGSPSFVPRVFRSCFAVRGSCFAVRGSPSFVPRVFRSCFAVRGSQSFVPRTVIDRAPTLFQNHHEPRTTNRELRSTNEKVRTANEKARTAKHEREMRGTNDCEPRTAKHERKTRGTNDGEPRTAKHEPRTAKHERKTRGTNDGEPRTANREARTKNARHK